MTDFTYEGELYQHSYDAVLCLLTVRKMGAKDTYYTMAQLWCMVFDMKTIHTLCDLHNDSMDL